MSNASSFDAVFSCVATVLRLRLSQKYKITSAMTTALSAPQIPPMSALLELIEESDEGKGDQKTRTHLDPEEECSLEGDEAVELDCKI